MIILPIWLQNLPESPQKPLKVNRFYMRLAALYATEEGTLPDLAFLMGMNYHTLKSQTYKVFATDKTRFWIRANLGEIFVPPEKPKS